MTSLLFFVFMAVSPPPAVVRTAPTVAADLTGVRNDERFKAAMTIIEDNGERIDFAGARTLSSPQAPGQREIVFEIRGSAGRPPDFSRVVYLERRGEPPLVYFDGPTLTTEPPGTIMAPKTESETAQRLGCLFKPWGAWQQLRSYCAFRYWCFFHNQRAVFIDETRRRQCPNGIQVENRTIVAHCGC